MRIVFRPPASEVPDHHRAAAIFTLRNNALKFVVRDRMIFDLNGESLFAWYQAWTTRHRPALHDAIKFQPKIVMQASRSMFLNDIGVAARASDCALWFEAWTTRHRPALHDAIKFQPKIVMQASRSMFLNDIGVAARASDCALWF